MADNSVTTTFFANERDAHAAIVRLEKKYADLEAKIKNVGKSSRQSAGDGLSHLNMMAAGVGRLALAWASIPALIGAAMASNKAFADQSDQSALKFDRAQRKFQIQSGQNALQTDKNRAQIRRNRIRTATETDFADAMTTEMVGEGFPADEAAGDAGLAMMELAKATGGDVDPVGLARAFAMALTAKGKAKNGAETRKLAVAIQRLYKETSLRPEDLVDLAAKLEVTGTKTPMETDLALFDLLRQEMPADVAATGFKIFFDRLQTIKGRPSDVALLRRAKLKPEDVDLVGESPEDVLDRLAAGLEGLPENIQNMVLSGLFEERGRLSAALLIRRRKEIPNLKAKMGDVLGFQKDLEVATAGPAAAEVRERQIKEEKDAAESTNWNLKLAAAERKLRDQGAPPWRRDVQRWIADWTNAIPGVSDDTALSIGFGLSREPAGRSGRIVDEARGDTAGPAGSRGLDRLIERIDAQIEELKQINENTRRTPRREGVGPP